MTDIIPLVLAWVLSRGYVCAEPPGWREVVAAEVTRESSLDAIASSVVRAAKCKQRRLLAP